MLLLSIRSAYFLLAAAFQLSAKGRQRAIGIDLASSGELQFCRSVIHELARRRTEDLFCVFHHDDTEAAFDAEFPELAKRVMHLPFRFLWLRCFRQLDLFITTEQFIPGPLGVYTLTLFHGQPSKGVTFLLPESDVLIANDALFLYGPLHKQALNEHLAFWNRKLPSHLSLFEIGYTKSDGLLNGKFDRPTLLVKRSLDPLKKTVLYAPAFNEGASLREHGLEILETLCAMKHLNVLAKLPIDCLKPTSNLIANGGKKWFEIIGQLEAEYENFRLERDLEVDPALACADVVVTCVSSVGFEFLALKRPVVFFDTPRFYSNTLQSFFRGRDLSGWAKRTTVNGGREFGPLVSDCKKLPAVIDEVLSKPDAFPIGSERLPSYLLFNPGNATAAAVAKIEELLNLGVRSRRPAASLAILYEVSGFRRFVTWPKRRIRRALAHLNTAFKTWLRRRGYVLNRTGLDFIDAKTTIAAAREAGLSICDYRESIDPDKRKHGRRDAIICEMSQAGLLTTLRSVCEIGAGTGQFLEKVLTIGKPATYEVYETDLSWASYLRASYSQTGVDLIVHSADGYSLRNTKSASCDLVHAHAVFVYLPLLIALDYLKECARVCRPGGHIMFDCFTEESMDLSSAQTWLAGGDRFPVIIPKALLEQFAQTAHLELLRTFQMPYGPGAVDYFIWRYKG